MRWILCLLAGISLSGCVSPRPGASATAVDASMATPDYWYDQPAAAQITGDDYDALWGAAERVARNRLFDIDRKDYRNGVLTTRPLISQQLFEVWRRDTPLSEQTQSTLGTVRRTIRFDLERGGDGQPATLSPRVLIERQSIPDRRITSSAYYRAATAVAPAQVDETGQALPTQYWYAIGRDTELEKQLAREVGEEVSRK